MANNAKKYIITAVTLGVIAAASAGLIGLTNLFTAKQIALNEQKRIKAGIVEIFADDAEILEEKAVSNKELKYTNYEYTLNKGVAFRTTGSNMYGKISMLVGYGEGIIPGSSDIGYKFAGIYLITNEQTYASTLVENYVTPLNNDDINYDDVKCGATYGATLIKEMIEETNKIMEGRKAE